MGITNFPNGITSFGMPVIGSGGVNTTGEVFFVSSVIGSDGNEGSKDRPFATIDYAIGRCTASKASVIFVYPDHAETVSGTIGMDVAGVRVIGLGVGRNRPTLTFDTTTDVVDITAAGCEWANMIHVCDVASHSRFVFLDGNADGAYINHNLFREGADTGLSMVEWEGAADDVRIEDNEFYAPTAGNYDEAILIASTPTRWLIERNRIIGYFDEGGINNASGNVATLGLIKDNIIVNLLAGA